jgi:hypothetical protein
MTSSDDEVWTEVQHAAEDQYAKLIGARIVRASFTATATELQEYIEHIGIPDALYGLIVFGNVLSSQISEEIDIPVQLMLDVLIEKMQNE